MNDSILDLDNDLINHLGDPDSVTELRAEHVDPEIIVDQTAADALEWQLQHLREHGKAAKPAVIESHFGVTLEEPQTAVHDLIGRLRERYIRNEGQQVVMDLGTLAVRDPFEVSAKMVAEGKRLNHLTTPRGESFGSGDTDRAMKAYHLLASQGRGPSIGWKELDEFYYGLKGVSFLVAPPKTYKSWVSTRSTLMQIIQGGAPYHYSLELPANESSWRLACMAADVPYWRFLRGKLSEEDLKLVEGTMQQLDASGVVRIEKARQGSRSAAHLVERALNAGATSVIIDQLQYMETRNGRTLGALNNTGDYFEVCNDLRDYSDEIPIYVVHQFNRSVMGSEGMPEFQQIKGSAAIEEVATLVLGMFANKDMRKSRLLQIGTLLSRNYGHANWEIKVELSKGCDFKMAGEIKDE